MQSSHASDNSDVHDEISDESADASGLRSGDGEALEAALVDPSQAEQDIKPTRVMATQRRGSVLALESAMIAGKSPAKPTSRNTAGSARHPGSRLRSVGSKGKAATRDTAAGEKVQIMELGSLLPGDYVGEAAILSVAHGV